MQHCSELMQQIVITHNFYCNFDSQDLNIYRAPKICKEQKRKNLCNVHSCKKLRIFITLDKMWKNIFYVNFTYFYLHFYIIKYFNREFCNFHLIAISSKRPKLISAVNRLKNLKEICKLSKWWCMYYMVNFVKIMCLAYC